MFSNGGRPPTGEAITSARTPAALLVGSTLGRMNLEHTRGPNRKILWGVLGDCHARRLRRVERSGRRTGQQDSGSPDQGPRVLLWPGALEQTGDVYSRSVHEGRFPGV